MKDLSMIRGDTKPYKFKRRNKDGEVIYEKAEKIYFTVKETNLPNEIVLQKTIDDMLFDEEGIYHFTIEPEDTDGLPFTNYKYDLQTINNGVKTTIARGKFNIEEEVTFSVNEV